MHQKLKNDWHFTGFVISDAGAVPGMVDLHHTAENYPEAAKLAIENGLDVIFQTAYQHFPLLFQTALIDEKAVNTAVTRVLRAKFRLGLFENPYVSPDMAQKWNGHPEHRKLAHLAALKSIVLLKNNEHILPINENLRAIAVIGTDAVEARLGGYSGPGNDKMSILEGIKKKVGESTTVYYVPGCGREAAEYGTIASDFLSTKVNARTVKGLRGEYFNNIQLAGKPVLSRIDSQIQFRWTLFSPQPEVVNYDSYSVRWSGKLRAPRTGNFKIGIQGNDGYRLYLNDRLIIDNWQKQT